MENLKTYPNNPVNVVTEETTIAQMGLTKREHFAAMALQGIISNPNRGSAKLADISKSAVILADALINELNKEQT